MSADPPVVIHGPGRGAPMVLVTCGICYCAVVERFWDKHRMWIRGRWRNERAER